MTTCTQCGRELEPSRAAQAAYCTECEHAAAPAAPEAQSSSAPSTAGPVLQPRAPVPVTLVLVGINVLVFVGMVLRGASFTQPRPEQLLSWGANFGPLTLTGQWWRLATAMFVHIGFLHLAINIWCLWELGRFAEQLYGRRTFLGLYFCAGLAASISSLIWNPLVPSAGASGAIFGTAGALIATLYLAKLPAPRHELRVSLISLVVFTVFNVAYGVWVPPAWWPFHKGPVDNAAHIGGLVSGLLLGSVLSLDFPREAPRRSPIRTILFPVFAVLLAAGIVAVRYVHTPVIRLQEAQQALGRGNSGPAIRELNEVIRSRPNYAAAWALLGAAYLQVRDSDKAEAALRRATELQPQNPLPLKELGLLYLSDKRFGPAQTTYQRLAKMDPKDVDTQLKLGFVEGELGNNQAAAASFRNATSLAPNLPLAWFNFGLASMNLKKYDDAVEAFTRVTKLAPKDGEAWIWLANAYQAKGMTEQADAAYLTGYRLRAAARGRQTR